MLEDASYINNESGQCEDDMEMELLGISGTSVISSVNQTFSKEKNIYLNDSKVTAADTLLITKLKEDLDEYKARYQDAEKTIMDMEHAIENQQLKHRQELLTFRDIFDKTEADFWRKIKSGETCMLESEKIIKSYFISL